MTCSPRSPSRRALRSAAFESAVGPAAWLGEATRAPEAGGPELEFEHVMAASATRTIRAMKRAILKPSASYHDSALPEWLLVDGSSMIFRAFYGVPQTNRAPDGTLINAVRGFLDRLASLINERKPKRVAVTTDEDSRPDWRVEPVPPLLDPQMPVIMDCLAAVGVDVVGLDGYEAGDIIATLVAKVEPPIEI